MRILEQFEHRLFFVAFNALFYLGFARPHCCLDPTIAAAEPTNRTCVGCAEVVPCQRGCACGCMFRRAVVQSSAKNIDPVRAALIFTLNSYESYI